MDALLADLNDWEMVAEQQDQELRQAGAQGGSDPDKPGVRRGKDPNVKPKEPEFVPLETNKPEVIHATKQPGGGARHTYDNYQKKWDKWDNAEFIEDVLTEEAKKEEDEAKQKQERASKVAKPKVSDLVRQAPVKKGLNSVEKKILADKEKEKGNECFKSGEYDTALEYYARGLTLHENAVIYANRAMAYLRLDRPADAVKDCDSALRVDPSYKKALFRRGLAYKALKSWDDAAADLKAALTADPDNKQILKELTAVERGQAEARKNRFKRMAVEEVGDEKKPTAAPQKTFKRIAVEEDSDSDSDEESGGDEEAKQEAPPVAQARRIAVEESSDEDEDEDEEESAPAKPAFTRVAVEEDSSDEDSSDNTSEQEKASPPPIAAAPRRIVVEESSSDDEDEEAASPVPVPPVVEDCAEALKIKAEGNLHFQGGRYEQAIEAYTRSLEKLPREDHPEAVKIYSNRAACHAQGGNHRQVVADCNAALALEPTAIKALMRRSHALESLEKFGPALDDMKAVLKLDWNIKEAQTARQRLESFVRAEHKMNGTTPEPKKEAWAQPAAKQPDAAPKVGVQPKKRIVVEEDSSDDDEEEAAAKKTEPAKTAPPPKVFEQSKKRIVVEEDSSDSEEEVAAKKTEPAKTTSTPKVVEQAKKRIVVEEDSDADSDDEDEITPEERVANATKAKDQGNAAFKQRDFGEAVRMYTLAIECQCEDTTLVGSLYNNRAMAELKVGASMPEGSLERFSSFKQALKDTTTVLKTEPDNVKALFRKGQAYMGLDEYEHAARELAEVVRLQPTNKAAKTELAQANAKLAQIKTVEAAVSKHLAGGDGGDDAQSSIVMPGTAKSQAKAGGTSPMISEVDASVDKKKDKKLRQKKKGSKPMIIEEVAVKTTSTGSGSSAQPKSSPKSSPRGMPAPLQIGKPSVPSNPPVSSTAFEQQYNRLKKYPELFCDYLQLIKPETLPKLFRSSITADMLLAIVSCLSSEFLGKRGMAKEAFMYTQNLSKIGRMSTTLLAMTRDERAQLTDLLDQLENIGGKSAGFEPSDIGPLRAVLG